MIPDITIPGLWITYFLIYWACSMLFYIGVIWTTFPRSDWVVYIIGFFRCLLIPILLPLRIYLVWKWNREEKEFDEAPSRHEQKDRKPTGS